MADTTDRDRVVEACRKLLAAAEALPPHRAARPDRIRAALVSWDRAEAAVDEAMSAYVRGE